MNTNITKIPSIEKFTSLDITEIRNIVHNQKISCVYLAIDGTRRHFIIKTGIDYSDPSFFDKYFDGVIEDTIKLLKMIYNHGIKNIIVLLMDNSAFTRGEKYLSAAIKKGIEPTLSDERFLSFYESYKINVHFAGFNDIYSDLGFNYLIENMDVIQKNTTNNDLNLVYYTGSSPDQDYIRLIRRYNMSKFVTENTLPNEQAILKDFYGQDIPKIDFSIYFGYPREKVKPILLWGHSVNFHTNNPTLSLNELQLRKAIYLTIFSRTHVKDNYNEYLLKSGSVSEFQNIIIGEEEYLNHLNLI